MLVLSRKRNEQIDIGDGTVTVTVVEIRGDKVRLGIEAPLDVPVHRMEIADRLREERREEEKAKDAESEGHDGR